ncbi:MAG: hypothetical protein QM762_12400 [Chryseolinea sp.]
MIKALKDKTIVLGLSETNIQKLKQDLPIKFNLKELGLTDHDVVIFYGKSESDMINVLYPHIGPDTILR